MLNTTQWLLIAIGCSLAVLLLVLLLYKLRSKFSLDKIRFLHKIVLYNIRSAFRILSYYHILKRRRYYGSVTFLDAIILILYLFLNGFFMQLGVHVSTQLSMRCGTMALINIIPLFLGGPTSYFANFFGIPIYSYYLAHSWIGGVVVLQGLLHSIPMVVANGGIFDPSEITVGLNVLLYCM
jgi:hypothetical protein